MNRRIPVLIGAIVLAVVVVVAARGFAQRPSVAPASTPNHFDNSNPNEADDTPARDQWEYLIVSGGTTNFSPSGSSSMRKENTGSFTREAFPLEQNMDKLGAKGWELVSVTGTPADPVYYFKRRK